MKVYRKEKRYHTVFHQLAVFFILASILPIGVMGSYMYGRYNELATQELSHSYELLCEQYIGNVQEKLAQYENSIAFISDNTVINEQLGNVEMNPYIRANMVSEEVYKSLLADGQSAVRNCVVYSNMEYAPLYGRRVSMFSAARRENWYRSWQERVGEWFFYEDPLNPGTGIGVLVYPVNRLDLVWLRQERIGIVKLELYLDRLLAPAGNGKDSFQVVAFDDDGTVWYQTNKAESMEFREAVREDAGKQRGLQIINGQMVAVERLEDCGLNLLLFFGKDGMEEKRREVNAILLPFTLFVAGLVSIGCYFFARGFSGRVNLLVDKFKKVETGDFSVTAPISGNDEIKILDNQFNHMLETIRNLIQKNYIQELEKKETELRNLELQINPHFLYNTLETISSIAAVQQVFTVCELCGRLGDIFRYSLGKDYGEFVMVGQELHHVKNYVYIQKVRYRDKFKVFYYVEPEVERCRIARFILQPIVENAILHGIAPMEGNGTLEIAVERNGDTLCVRVEDDGIGMDGAHREELEAYIDSSQKDSRGRNSIGIRNVHQRIRLTYGEPYGVKIESSPGGGSRFLITFPLQLMEKK